MNFIFKLKPMSYLIALTLLFQLTFSCSSIKQKHTNLVLGSLEIDRQDPVTFGPPLLSKQAQIVDTGETILFGFIQFDEVKKTEAFKLGTCPYNLDMEECRNIYTLFEGPFAYHPRFHTREINGQKEIWASWCGLHEIPIPDEERFKHSTSFFLQKVWPALGATTEIEEPEGFTCGQSLAFEGGTIHMAYERTGPSGMDVYYRTMDAETGLVGDEIVLSDSHFARRPSLALLKPGTIAVAFDQWWPKRLLQSTLPDYDLILVTINVEGIKSKVAIDQSSNLTQAADLKSDGQNLWLAYHQGSDGILKHWQMRKINFLENGDVEIIKPKISNPFLNNNPKEENQGAEFPQIWGFYNGMPILTSRPSHNGYVHFLNGDKLETITLDEDGWGARDLWMSGILKDNHFYLAHRGAKKIYFENFTLSGKMAPLTFESETIIAEKKIIDKTNFAHPHHFSGVLYGDVHMHSGMSDGTGTPDEIYARAFERGLDFAVLTDHDNIVGSRLFPSQYYEIIMITDLFDGLPDFSTLQGYEWTTPSLPAGSGHKNVYFKDKAPVPVYSFKHDFETTEKLYDAFSTLARKKAVFTAPHHTGWTGTDWEKSDPKIQRHFEVASVHGIFEDKNDNPLKDYTRGDMEGMFARDGIKKGYKFGFLGGSDAHGLISHHGHGRFENPWVQGLTGVFCSHNDRQSLFNALYSQQTFATSGPPMLAQVWILPKSKKQKYKNSTLHFKVEATAPLKEIILVIDGQVVWKKEFNMEEKVLKDLGSIALKNIPVVKTEHGHHTLYIRATQDSPHLHLGSGERQVDMAFSSPIFLN